MAQVITDLDDAIDYINVLYNNSSTAPSSTEEDYLVWKSMINVSVSSWENEEGMLWNELFVKLSDAPDGDTTTSAGDYSYAVPTLFRFPASGYVWVGSGTNKTAFKIIKQQDLQLYENNRENWCYFLMDGSPTLEFNPNLTITGGYTISYNYYKKASTLTTGSSTFEMSDPMFSVFYVLSELKKEEGNSFEVQMMNNKMEAMKLRNIMPTWQQDDTFSNQTEPGFGY